MKTLKPILIICYFLFLSLLFFGNTLYGQQIKGIIVDKNTGKPISEVEVKLLNAGSFLVPELITKTDSSGRFEFILGGFHCGFPPLFYPKFKLGISTRGYKRIKRRFKAGEVYVLLEKDE